MSTETETVQPETTKMPTKTETVQLKKRHVLMFGIASREVNYLDGYWVTTQQQMKAGIQPIAIQWPKLSHNGRYRLVLELVEECADETVETNNAQ